MSSVDQTGAVGFIGLGQIGKPMAERLTQWPAGLWVCDLDSNATAALAAQGANVAATAREVAEHTDCVSIMVRDDKQVNQVLAGPDGLLAGARRGTVVLVHSTIHPDTARELDALASPHGVRVLDAPVSGGSMGAATGRLAILVGGEEAAFERARPMLDRMGEMVVRLGPIGTGTAAKLARNLLHFVSFTAATEALALAEAAQIDLEVLGQVVRHTDSITGGAGAIMWRKNAGPLDHDDPWFPILTHVAQLGEKDLAYAVELGDRHGVDTALADLALTRLATGLGVAALEGAQ